MPLNLMHPKSRWINAYVGSFSDDLLGTFTGENAPMQAISAAREAGYRFVSLMYGNGNMETVETGA